MQTGAPPDPKFMSVEVSGELESGFVTKHSFFNNGAARCVTLFFALGCYRLQKIGICNFSVLNEYAEFQAVSLVACLIVG